MKSILIINIFVTFVCLLLSPTIVAQERKRATVQVDHLEPVLGYKKPIRFFVYKAEGIAPKGVIVPLYSGYEGAINRLQAEIRGGNQNNRGYTITKWALDNNFAVVIWDTQFMGLEKAWWGKDQKDLTGKLRKQRDDFIDCHCASMNKGLEMVLAKFQLPTQGLCLAGSSKGAVWSSRMLNRYPKKYSTAIIHNAHSFDKNTSALKDVFILFTSGEYDTPGREQTMHFFQRHRKEGGTAFLHVMEGGGHTYPATEEKIHYLFLDYYYNQKKRLVEVRKDLATATWFYDYINFEVFSQAKVEFIPVSQRVLLPNQTFANLWK